MIKSLLPQLDHIRLFSADQARAARGLLGWSVRRLAEVATLDYRALRLFETGRAGLGQHELERLGAALHAAGVMPIPAASAGEGVRFRAASSTGRRTSFARPKASLPAWLPIGDGALDPGCPDAIATEDGE